MRIILKKAKNGAIAFLFITLTIAFGSCTLKGNTDIDASTAMTQTTETQTTTSINAELGVLYKSLSEHFIEEENGTRRFDLTNLNLHVTSASDEAINEVMLTLIPSFDPEDYSIYKTADNEADDTFLVRYRLKVGEYVTTQGYQVTYENNQAKGISEYRVSRVLPSAAEIAKLPVVTEEMKQAAYQQGREDVYAQNEKFVVQEQSGEAKLDLDTNECYYQVSTVYTISAESPLKGVIGTKYMIE